VQRRSGQREIDGALPHREFVGGESHWFQGRQYRLRISQQAGRTSASARLDGNFIAVDVPRGACPPRIGVTRCVVRSSSGTATAAVERLPRRVAVYAAALGVPAPPVHVRDQEKRWGSCAPSGELRFNWRVMMGPLSLVDYVVAHEVCHLVHPDHSDAFWRLLRPGDPRLRAAPGAA
jgi:predicted metal-dependent hydrolase